MKKSKLLVMHVVLDKQIAIKLCCKIRKLVLNKLLDT